MKIISLSTSLPKPNTNLIFPCSAIEILNTIDEMKFKRLISIDEIDSIFSKISAFHVADILTDIVIDCIEKGIRISLEPLKCFLFTNQQVGMK